MIPEKAGTSEEQHVHVNCLPSNSHEKLARKVTDMILHRKHERAAQEFTEQETTELIKKFLAGPAKPSKSHVDSPELSQLVNTNYVQGEVRAKHVSTNLQRPEEKDSTVFYCRRSGLQMFRNPALPYAAMLLEIPFASFTGRTVEKIYRDGLRRDANLETRIFCFYTAIANMPVEYGPECKRPHIPASEWDKFLSRNLHALCKFASWYTGAPDFLKNPKSKRCLPRLRLTHYAEAINLGVEQRDYFRQIRQALSLWTQLKQEYDSGITKSKQLDNLLKEAVEQGTVGMMQYSLKDLKLKLKNFSGTGKLCRFDRAHVLADVLTKKRGPVGTKEESALALFEKLLEVYEVQGDLRYKFILFAQNPLSRNIKKLEAMKNQFVECWNFFDDEDDGIKKVGEPAGEAEQEEDDSKEFSFQDLSELHYEFIRWLKFHIEELSKAQNMMQDMEVLEQEEAEEAKIQEFRKAAGLPLRENFPNFTAYMSALKAWKAEQANSSK